MALRGTGDVMSDPTRIFLKALQSIAGEGLGRDRVGFIVLRSGRVPMGKIRVCLSWCCTMHNDDAHCHFFD